MWFGSFSYIVRNQRENKTYYYYYYLQRNKDSWIRYFLRIIFFLENEFLGVRVDFVSELISFTKHKIKGMHFIVQLSLYHQLKVCLFIYFVKSAEWNLEWQGDTLEKMTKFYPACSIVIFLDLFKLFKKESQHSELYYLLLLTVTR